MKNKFVFLIVFAIFVFCFIGGVNASPINISNCINITSSGDYILNRTINFSLGHEDDISCIRIKADNINIDFDNYGIIGLNNSYGIYSYQHTNITITKGEISNFTNGIQMDGSDNITISYMRIFNNSLRGIVSGVIGGVTSDYWEISNNNLSNNNYRAGILSNKGLFWNITRNYIEKTNYDYNSIAIWNLNSRNNTIYQNTIYNCSSGIYFEATNENNGTSYNKAYNNTITYSIALPPVGHGSDDFGRAFTLDNSSNNEIYNNIANLSYNGIRIVVLSQNNLIYNNTFLNNTNGVYISSSRLNNFTDNNLTNNNISIKSAYELETPYENRFSSSHFNEILISNIHLNFSINNLFFKTIINTTIKFIDNKFNVFNRTNTLFHNSTSICNGSSADISSNTGNVNITLAPNGQCYVLDNFNLTEGISREHSPLWINDKTTVYETGRDVITYHLASNLSDNVNISFYLNNSLHACSESLSMIKFISRSGVVSYPDYSCSNGLFTQINLTNYEESSDSNTLQIIYEYNTGSPVGGSFSTSTNNKDYYLNVSYENDCENDNIVFRFNVLDNDKNLIEIKSLSYNILPNYTEIDSYEENKTYFKIIKLNDAENKDYELYSSATTISGEKLDNNILLDIESCEKSLYEAIKEKIFNPLEEQKIFPLAFLFIIISVIIIVLFFILVFGSKKDK